MKTTAAVLYGKDKIKVMEYDMPEITDDEILVKVISNSLCLSTCKAAHLGEDHKRVPSDISENPVMTGHEFAGIIVKVGKNLQHRYKPQEKFVLQPAMGLESGYSPGYSYPYFGGNATYCIIPKVAIDLNCVLDYNDDYFANASLAEPMCCIIGAFEACYHTIQYDYTHYMGIRKGGKVALLGSTGPMGIGAINYAINSRFKPSLVVVTEINQASLDRAKTLISEEYAKAQGVELVYVNTSLEGSTEKLLELTNGTGFDDVFAFVASAPLLEQADKILGNDGCLNFFAGPSDKNFKVPFNFYNVHYESTHVVGTSGGSPDDMKLSLKMSAEGTLNPSYMVTHIGGLDCCPEAILNLDTLKAGKRVIYPHINMPLTAISDFEKLGENDEMFKTLAEICKKTNNVWSKEAEKYLLDYHNVDIYAV